jgi:hypothetical protein
LRVSKDHNASPKICESDSHYVYARIRLDTAGYAWIRLDTSGYGWIRLDTLGCRWIRLDAGGYAWMQVDAGGHTPTREKLTPTMEKLKERSDEGNVRQRPDEGNVRLTPDEGNVRQNFLLDPDEKIVQGDSKLTERRIKCRHEMIMVS